MSSSAGVSATAPAADDSLLGLLVGARATPAQEAARQRADALYAFQGATVQCVPCRARSCARPRRRRWRRPPARGRPLPGQPFPAAASPRARLASRSPRSPAPPRPAPRRAARRKHYGVAWRPANRATQGARSEPSGAMDCWPAAWRLRRAYEEATEARKAAGKPVY